MTLFFLYGGKSFAEGFIARLYTAFSFPILGGKGLYPIHILGRAALQLALDFFPSKSIAKGWDNLLFLPLKYDAQDLTFQDHIFLPEL